jgi:hypothetical protein
MQKFTNIKNSTLTTLLSLSVLLLANPSQAASIKFNTWNSSGDVIVPADGEVKLSNSSFGAEDDYGYNPSAPDTYNYTQNNPSIDAGGPLEDFLGLNIGDLDINGTAFQGSAITKLLSAVAGDQLTFKWEFLTNETANLPPFSPLNDYAFFVVNGTLTKLADVRDALNISSFFNSETGEGTFSYLFTQTGSYQIGIGVVDIDDYTYTSALEIREAKIEGNIQTVPEPLTVFGSVMAFGFGILFCKRKANDQREFTHQ